MSKTHLKDIELFFDSYEFNDREFILDKWTKIKNVKQFVTSHVSILKGGNSSDKKMPYYDRLLKLYLKLK